MLTYIHCLDLFILEQAKIFWVNPAWEESRDSTFVIIIVVEFYISFCATRCI